MQYATFNVTGHFSNLKHKVEETTYTEICLLICYHIRKSLEVQISYIYNIYCYMYIYKHQFLYYVLLSLKTIICVLHEQIQIIFIPCNSSSFCIKKSASPHPIRALQYSVFTPAHILIATHYIIMDILRVPGQCHQQVNGLGLIRVPAANTVL